METVVERRELPAPPEQAEHPVRAEQAPQVVPAVPVAQQEMGYLLMVQVLFHYLEHNLILTKQ